MNSGNKIVKTHWGENETDLVTKPAFKIDCTEKEIKIYSVIISKLLIISQLLYQLVTITVFGTNYQILYRTARLNTLVNYYHCTEKKILENLFMKHKVSSIFFLDMQYTTIHVHLQLTRYTFRNFFHRPHVCLHIIMWTRTWFIYICVYIWKMSLSRTCCLDDWQIQIESFVRKWTWREKWLRTWYNPND